MTPGLFVDRVAALDAFDRFLTDPRQLLVYSGMSGLGKSYLLAELARRLGQQRARILDLDTLVETAPGGHADIAFALTDAVAAACAQWTGDQPRRYQAARRQAARTLADAYARVPTVSLTATGGASIRNVSVTLVTEPAAVRAAGVRAQQRTLLAEALAADLHGCPLADRVLLFDSVERLPYLDDVAGPDDESPGARQTSWFLSELLPRLLRTGLRVVLAGREPPSGRPDAVHVTLAEWEPAHTAELLAERGIADDDLASAIHTTCHGLPGWVDLAAAAVTAARAGGGGLTAAEIARRAATHPVQRWLPDVFLDRLPPAAQAVVTAAAVPRVLGRAAVAALLDDVPAHDDDWFTALNRYSFVRTEFGADGEVSRTLHPLVRTALLESLRRNDPGLLRRLHERARVYFADVGMGTEELYHRLALGDPTAVESWRQRCDDAVAAADLAGARTALDLVLVPEQRGVLLAAYPVAVIEGELTAAVVCRYTHRFDEAVAHLAEVDRLAGRHRQRDALAAAAQERARLALRRDQISEGIDEARVALQLAEDLDLPGEIGDAHDLLGDLSVRAGDLGAARGHFLAAITAYRRAGTAVGEANALLSLGGLTVRIGRREDAHEYLEAALARYLEAGRRGGQADAHQGLGEVDIQLGDLDSARRHLLTAQRINRTLDDDLAAANCRYRLGEVALAGGDAHEAEAAFRDVEREFERLRDHLGVANAYRGLGAAALHRRDFPAAEDWLTRAELAYDALGSSYGQAMCRYLRGRVLLERHDHIEAARQFVLALAAFGKSDDRGARAHTQVLLGLLQVESGDVTRGEALLRSARDEFASTARAEDLARVDATLAEIEADRSDALGRLDGLSRAGRLLLDLLALLHPADRFSFVLGGVWPAAWGESFPGRPDPGLDRTLATLVTDGLVATQRVDTPDVGPVVEYSFPDPGLRVMVRDAVDRPRRDLLNGVLAAAWIQVFLSTRDAPTPVTVRAGAGAAVYAIECLEYDDAWAVLTDALPIAQSFGDDREILSLMREVAMRGGDSARYAAFAVARAGGPRQALAILDDDELAEDMADHLAAEIHQRFLDDHQPDAAHELADTMLARTTDAAHSRWLARRTQTRYALGRHVEVLAELDGVLAAVDRAAGELDDPDRLRIEVLHHGVGSAKATARWDLALTLNERIRHLLVAAGASAHELAHYRFSDYAALLETGRHDESEQLLDQCELVFRANDDAAQLRAVESARAILAARRGDPGAGLDLDRAALRGAYAAGDLAAAALVHGNYANHLRATGGDPAARVAHRLAAAVIYQLIGNDVQATRALLQAFAEPRRQGLRSTAPRALAGLAQIVGQVPGVDLIGLLATLNVPPATVNDVVESMLTMVRTNR